MINALIIWFIIVIVHGITRATVTTPIVQVVQKVTSVKHVERSPNDFIECVTDFEVVDEELWRMQKEGYDIKSWLLSNITEVVPSQMLQMVIREHERNLDSPFGPRRYVGKVRFKIVKPDPRLDEMQYDRWGRSAGAESIEVLIRRMMIENEKNPKKWGR